MKQLNPRKLLVAAASILVAVHLVVAQKPKPAAKPTKNIIFAVLNDGGTLEPIAYINKGKLEPAVNGSDERSIIAAFNRTYYRPGTAYKLIFGAAAGGSVTVKTSDSKAECSPNTAQAMTKATGTPLKGLVMALATNATVKAGVRSSRRRPTPAERTEIETLVKAEFTRQKAPSATLHYHNLTAIDVDNDGKGELIGSYWVEIDKTTRGLLFFVAEIGPSGKYEFGYSDYRSVPQSDVMSGDIKDVDEGIYNELLLDAFDYDADGVAEIFTYTQSFEGAGFRAYRRTAGKWSQVYDVANYHCGY